MSRVLRVTLVLYLAAAVWGHVKEARGELRCDCEPSCWCKRPGVSLLRWVLPFGHSVGD